MKVVRVDLLQLSRSFHGRAKKKYNKMNLFPVLSGKVYSTNKATQLGIIVSSSNVF